MGFENKKRYLSVLVENHSGVLSRIAGLFSRRGYNIDSLSVGTTESPNISRMTIGVTCDDKLLEQIMKQLHKLIPVLKVNELCQNSAMMQELALIKVRSSVKERRQVMDLAEIFKGQIVDVSDTSLTLSILGTHDKIDAAIHQLQTYGIKEMIRTGTTGLQRG
ncbi:acetolactate synthase small subunit [Fusibacter sp. JL216-2]|uniref:acetolactate synthase small subunit n=1 Tax=Fusibacter sp. JL216-2 TaxID=3071453 RepID=UPI003D3541F1